MRPFFLRTYEFTVEGQEVVVSQGGSLMDMRVGQGLGFFDQFRAGGQYGAVDRDASGAG
jgi:hypothetical protein